MTIDLAKETLLEFKGTTADKLLEAALGMAVSALESWENNLDIQYDYNAIAKEHKSMISHFLQDQKPVYKSGVWTCPACGKRISENHSYCHLCGKKVGWGRVSRRKGRK